jgi:ABC-2 type transport system ATP-binding protein
MLRDAFLEMRDRGKTLVLSTHQMETVEELCENVVIVDRGRIVIGGSVREVRRSSGRRVVRLGVEGDGDLPWLSEIGGVRIVRPGVDFSELHVDADRDPETVLTAALERGERVTRFEIADPSLDQVFIDLLGEAPETEERTLAAAGTRA